MDEAFASLNDPWAARIPADQGMVATSTLELTLLRVRELEQHDESAVGSRTSGDDAPA